MFTSQAEYHAPILSRFLVIPERLGILLGVFSYATSRIKEQATQATFWIRASVRLLGALGQKYALGTATHLQWHWFRVWSGQMGPLISVAISLANL